MPWICLKPMQQFTAVLTKFVVCRVRVRGNGHLEIAGLSRWALSEAVGGSLWGLEGRGTWEEVSEALTLRFSIVGFISLKASIHRGYWLFLERGSEGPIWILMGGMLWILPTSVRPFAHKEGDRWFSRDKLISVSKMRYIFGNVTDRANRRH